MANDALSGVTGGRSSVFGGEGGLGPRRIAGQLLATFAWRLVVETTVRSGPVDQTPLQTLVNARQTSSGVILQTRPRLRS